MLGNARGATRLPSPGSGARQAVVSEKLGLEPAEERPGGLLYRFSNGEFALYGSGGASPGTFTQMGFEVDDLDSRRDRAQAPGSRVRGSRHPRP